MKDRWEDWFGINFFDKALKKLIHSNVGCIQITENIGWWYYQQHMYHRGWDTNGYNASRNKFVLATVDWYIFIVANKLNRGAMVLIYWAGGPFNEVRLRIYSLFCWALWSLCTWVRPDTLVPLLSCSQRNIKVYSFIQWGPFPTSEPDSTFGTLLQLLYWKGMWKRYSSFIEWWSHSMSDVLWSVWMASFLSCSWNEECEKEYSLLSRCPLLMQET